MKPVRKYVPHKKCKCGTPIFILSGDPHDDTGKPKEQTLCFCCRQDIQFGPKKPNNPLPKETH